METELLVSQLPGKEFHAEPQPRMAQVLCRLGPEASTLPSYAAGGDTHQPSGTGLLSPTRKCQAPVGTGLHPCLTREDCASGPLHGLEDGEPLHTGPSVYVHSLHFCPTWGSGLGGRQRVPTTLCRRLPGLPPPCHPPQPKGCHLHWEAE